MRDIEKLARALVEESRTHFQPPYEGYRLAEELVRIYDGFLDWMKDMAANDARSIMKNGHVEIYTATDILARINILWPKDEEQKGDIYMTEKEDSTRRVVRVVREYLEREFSYTLAQIREVAAAEEKLRRRDFTEEAWGELQSLLREKKYWFGRLADEVFALVEHKEAMPPETPNP